MRIAQKEMAISAACMNALTLGFLLDVSAAFVSAFLFFEVSMVSSIQWEPG